MDLLAVLKEKLLKKQANWKAMARDPQAAPHDH